MILKAKVVVALKNGWDRGRCHGAVVGAARDVPTMGTYTAALAGVASHGVAHAPGDMAFASGAVTGVWPGFGAPGAWPRGAWPGGAAPNPAAFFSSPTAASSSRNAGAFPDSWPGPDAMTLNPNFTFANQSYPVCGSRGSATGDESQLGENEVPVQVVRPSSARRGRGGQRAANGGRQGGGRVGRPPIPTAPAAPDATVVNINRTRARLASFSLFSLHG